MKLVRIALTGAGSFWIPDVLVHAIAGRHFSGIHVLLLTLLLPVAFTCAYVVTRRHYRDSRFIALPMLVGLWFLGGIFMLASASFSGGGFTVSEGLGDTMYGVLLSFLPPYTFMMATYDGALFALLLATVSPIFAGLALREKQSQTNQALK